MSHVRDRTIFQFNIHFIYLNIIFSSNLFLLISVIICSINSINSQNITSSLSWSPYTAYDYTNRQPILYYQDRIINFSPNIHVRRDDHDHDSSSLQNLPILATSAQLSQLNQLHQLNNHYLYQQQQSVPVISSNANLIISSSQQSAQSAKSPQQQQQQQQGGYTKNQQSQQNNRLEWSTRKDRARFFLYPDHHDLYYYEELIPNSKPNLEKSKYNPNFYPIFIIHGFQGNYTESYNQHIKNAYLQMAFFANVILVDWSGLAQPGYKVIPNLVGYPSATKNVATIGTQVAEFIKFLIDYGALSDPTRAHVIGFSLGAHIAGIAGDNIQEWTGRLLGRITGLDPSGLDYHLRSKSTRLDRSDAEFVDIIHTAKGTYGYSWSLGHVDFWPNGGGPKQPGCRSPVDFIRDITGLPGSCAHAQSYEFFTQSIYHKTLACKADSYKEFQEYNGIKCEEPIHFGQYASYLGRGDYYLEIDEAEEK